VKRQGPPIRRARHVPLVGLLFHPQLKLFSRPAQDIPAHRMEVPINAAQRDLTGAKGSLENHDWRVECLEEGIGQIKRLIDPSVYYAPPPEVAERPEPQWMKEGFFEYDDKEAA
jgi:hypothetical protein